MKRFLVEIQIGFLVIVGVALVLAMGYMAYTGMSSILQNVSRESKPDVKLTLIQMLATDLKKAENSIRIYSFSRNNNDLKPYYRFLRGIDDQLDSLYDEGTGNEDFIKNLDTVVHLVGQKIDLWQEMLPLYTTTQTERYLDTLTRELESKIESDSLRESRTLLQKIFKRQEKVDLDEARLKQGIEEARVEDSLKTARIRTKEKQLAEASNLLTRQFYDLVKRMEAEELKLRRTKAAAADRMAAETNRWIGYFSLSAVLSLLLVIFVITRYTRKSHQYQKALIKAKQEAENLAKAKELFAANVSHELRTPINVISGFVNQLTKKSLGEEHDETIRIIKSSTDHLVRIVNDILDFTKLESGKTELEPIHFKSRENFEEVLALFGPSARKKNIALDLDVDDEVPEVLLGDPVRLKQILINLVGNALKFTESGSISVRVKALNQIAGFLDLHLTVQDTGIGIPEDRQGAIFEDFSQAGPETSRKFGGTGLGLSIVKRLVDLHGGDISVKSKVAEGTTFSCRIPYRRGNVEMIEQEPLASIVIPEEMKKKNILIVDDESYNRKLVASILGKWQIGYEEAESGEQALEKMKSGTFDLVLLDNRMPGMDGLDTAGEIRKKHQKDSDGPVLVSFTAATPSMEQQQKYKETGIVYALSKPFSEEQLYHLLTGIFLPGNPVVIEEEKKPMLDPDPKPVREPTDLDLEQLYRVSGGDEPFIREMLEKFLESFEQGFEKMQAAIKNEDFVQTGDAAHKLVSPCRHLGADNLVSKLKYIETQAEKESNQKEFEKAAEQVKSMYKNLKSRILEHLKTMQA